MSAEMASKLPSSNELESTPATEEAEEGSAGDWVSIGIAVRPETKRLIEALSARAGLRPSPFLRTLLLPILADLKQNAS